MMQKRLFIIQHPTQPTVIKYVSVDDEGDRHIEDDELLDLAVAPTTIRLTNADEKEAFEKFDGMYNCMPYPEFSRGIKELIEAWNNPLTVEEIIGIIMSESKSNCTTPYAIKRYFSDHYRNRFVSKQLSDLTEMLNLYAVRDIADRKTICPWPRIIPRPDDAG